MSAAFIIDCSLTMTWLFQDEATTATTELLERLATETALVPGLWHLEVTNVLAVAERAGRIRPKESDAFLDDLAGLDIEMDQQAEARAFGHLLPLCRKHQLSSYDATYLDLALRRKLPLGTLDEPLRKAAKKLRVKLLGK
jgi:predicted nucleic acid-binding protein